MAPIGRFFSDHESVFSYSLTTMNNKTKISAKIKSDLLNKWSGFIICLFILIPSFAKANQVDLLNASGIVVKSYSTIQECANIVLAGQACRVSAGSYDEFVSVLNSGNLENPIIFWTNGQVLMPGFSINGKNYIKIKGFEITNIGFTKNGVNGNSIYIKSSVGSEILNNHIHHTIGACIRVHYSGPSRSILIKENEIEYCGYPGRGAAGMQISGDHMLIEGNDISHADNFIDLNPGGTDIVVRNNVLHDSFLSEWSGSPSDPHIDGIQATCSPGGVPLKKALIENNRMYNTPDTNTHFLLLRDTGLCGVAEITVRYNTVYNIGSYFAVMGDNLLNIRVYNNTMVNIQVGNNPKQWDNLGFTANVVGGKIINNLSYNSLRAGGNDNYADASSRTGFFADYNLNFNSECGAACSWNIPQPPPGIGGESHSITKSDPLLINLSSDFNLQVNSPAKNAGGFLTKVVMAGLADSTVLKVEDAGYFQDGWAAVAADWIAVGDAKNSAQIVSIDYVDNIITLATPIHGEFGDSVWLYKNSNGHRVLYGNTTDIGAYEYDGLNQSSIVSGDVSGDGNVTIFDASLVAQYVVGLNPPNFNADAADVSGDNQVNIYDASLIAQYAVGLITKFPADKN